MRRNFYEVYRNIDDKSISNGIEVRWAGFASCPANFELKRYHKRYLLIYILEGLCLYYEDGKEYQAGPGDLLTFHPNELQHYKAEGEETLKYYGLSFSGPFIDSALADMPIMKQKIHRIGIEDFIKTKFHELIGEMLVLPEERVEIVWGLFFLLIGWLNSAILDFPKQHNRDFLRNRRIEKAAQYICQNYNSKLDIEIIAKVSGYSVSWFENLFYKQYGITPIKYQIEQRIEKAKEMLNTSLLNISEIGYAIGFNDPFHFSKTFKNHVGISPNQYRKKIISRKGRD